MRLNGSTTTLVWSLAVALMAGCEYPQEPVPGIVSAGPKVTDLGELAPINGSYQICNPSISQDTVGYPGCMLWLGFNDLSVRFADSATAAVYDTNNVTLHDRLTVTDFGDTVRWYLMKRTITDITGEIQDPEWSTHPDYIAFLGRGANNAWDGYVVRLSDKRVLKFCEDGVNETSTPHLWVGGSSAAPATSTGGRLANGLLPADSIYEYFGTTNVKLAYSRASAGLDLHMVDYSCDTCAVAPVLMPKPAGKETYKVESALISPDGNWVTYNCYQSFDVIECYVQRLKPGAPPILVTAGAEPHWWFYSGRQYLVYSTKGGVTLEDLLTAKAGAAGATMLQEVQLNAAGPQPFQFSTIGAPQELAPYPMKGGLSPDGFYLCTGYRWAYMFRFN